MARVSKGRKSKKRPGRPKSKGERLAFRPVATYPTSVAEAREQILARMSEPDRQLVDSGRDKMAHGERTTKAERSAILRHDQITEQVWREFAYNNIPRADWARMAGQKGYSKMRTLETQSGIPIGQSSIRLADVVVFIHSWLGQTIRPAGSNGEASGNGHLDSLEHWKKENEKAKAIRNKLTADMALRRVIPRDDHERDIGLICAAFRDAILRAGAALAPMLSKRSAPEARAVVEEWANRTVDQVFGDPDGRT